MNTTYPNQLIVWKVNSSPLQMYLLKAYVNSILRKTSMCNWSIWSIWLTSLTIDTQMCSVGNRKNKILLWFMDKVEVFLWNIPDLSSAFCKFQTRFSKGNVATMCQRKFELLCEMLDFDSPCLSFPQILHNSVSNWKFMKDLMQWNWKLIRLFHQQCGIFILFDTLHWVHFCFGAKTWKCNHSIVANFMLCLQNFLVPIL